MDQLFCNLLWPYFIALKLQIELGGIHRSQKVYSAKRQGVRKADFYSESVCVVIVVTRPVGDLRESLEYSLL